MRPIGGVFFRERDGIDARKLVAKVCDGGRVTTDDARAASGTEVVGFAVHPPRRGFWAIVDSADGALGIGGGAWSKVALAANHLGTDAIWFRSYAIDLALAVYFMRGGTWLRAYAGMADELITRLDGDGVPIHDSQPPRAAGADALLAAVAYDPGDYASGPDAELAARLFALHEALVAGDASAMRACFEAVPDEAISLALGIVRGADRGEWRACVQAAARQVIAAPPRMRVKLQQMTLDEEILRRAGELADTDPALTSLLDHLDAIETDAETRSSHSHPGGVALLADHFHKRDAFERALQCALRLLRRPGPSWSICNYALATLLKRSAGGLELDAVANEVIRRVESRLPDLGQSAVDAITYNLACVLARAGDAARALAALKRCREPTKQNAHPEQDSDLELLWDHPEFRSLVAAPPPAPPTAEEPDDEPVYQVPVAHAEPRFRIALAPHAGDDGALVDRLGGKPNAPTSDFAWPTSPRRPMDFVAQLVGKAGGGTIDLGDIHVLQIFADLEGDFYEPEGNAVIAHRVPCPAVVEPPPTVEIAPVRVMTLEPGFDDRRLRDENADEIEGFDSEAAHSHAWCDKIGGVAVGANLDPDLRDSADRPMRLVLELLSYDDWFLWALFANESFSELALEIVRG